MRGALPMVDVVKSHAGYEVTEHVLLLYAGISCKPVAANAELCIRINTVNPGQYNSTAAKVINALIKK